MNEPSIEVYWSFRSPYSYLATPGMVAIKSDYAVDLRFRPVLPIAVRSPDFFNPENLKRGRYIMQDWPRQARFLGLSDQWPSPDPIVQDMKTFKIAPDQPYIYRLTHLGIEAQRRGRGIEFAAEVSALLFSGVRGWDQDSHLTDATSRAGLDLADMEATIAQAGDSHAQEVEANHEALAAAGHWGVPTFVFDGQPYFGQDRIATLRWQLDNAGLNKPAS
ncbi:MAG: 2-hydroxychromene-2-carboxylate isomerase [Burkholderiaceae bacterium]